MKMKQLLVPIAATLAALSVLIGAFAAHALKAKLSPQALGWIETGVQYQQLHSLAILIIGFIIKLSPHWHRLDKAAYSFIIGTLLFSGSLYFMALTGITSLAILTPVGGLAFLLGWGLLIWAFVRADTNFGKKDDR